MKRSLALTLAMVGTTLGAGSLLPGCSNSNGTTDMGTTNTSAEVTPDQVTSGTDNKFVVSALTLPMTRSDNAIDLNGDGNADNALGNIIGALTAQNLDAQSGVDMSISSGDVILLIDVKADDLSSDDTVSATFNLGTKTANPKFDGTGTFTVDSAQPKAEFDGKIASGEFKSNNPVTTKHPVSITLKLALIAGADPVTLDINGAYVKGTVSANGIMSGQLNGSIKVADLQANIIPAMAKLLTSKITADPTSSSSMQIKSLFDTGGSNGMCTNPDNTMAAANDGKIDVCEVLENTIIQNVLAPDLQIWDGTTYSPQAHGTMKDSLSLGIGFTAVKGSF